MEAKHASYIAVALDEYSQIKTEFLEHLQSGKEYTPALRMEMSLDEREIRPEGLSAHDEW